MTLSQTSQPVETACGGTLTDPTRFPSASYRGRVVYFCNRACRRAFEAEFEAEPDAFMAGEVKHPADDADVHE